jgi:hypothetical protein
MRPYGALRCASLVFAGVAVVGCSAPVAGDVSDANGAVTRGIVLVERSVNMSRESAAGSTAEGVAPLTNVSAKFMRLSAAADAELAERVVGSPFDLPATGSCTVLSSTADDEIASNLSSLGSIELLDAGDVTVKAEGTEMPLAARAFPNVGDLVFGVFYTSRDAASDLPAPAKYVFESSGSGLLDRFEFEANAPGGPEKVRIDDADLTDGIELDEGVSAVVQWQTADAGGTSKTEDIVYVDVTSARGAAVRCAFTDIGHGKIPGLFLRASALGPLPTSATIAVHRVRQMQFTAPGVDLGEVRFDLSVLGRAKIAAH